MWKSDRRTMPAHSFIATAVDLFSVSPIDLLGAELDLRPHWLDAATAATWLMGVGVP